MLISAIPVIFNIWFITSIIILYCIEELVHMSCCTRVADTCSSTWLHNDSDISKEIMLLFIKEHELLESSHNSKSLLDNVYFVFALCHLILRPMKNLSHPTTRSCPKSFEVNFLQPSFFLSKTFHYFMSAGMACDRADKHSRNGMENKINASLIHTTALCPLAQERGGN